MATVVPAPKPAANCPAADLYDECAVDYDDGDAGFDDKTKLVRFSENWWATRHWLVLLLATCFLVRHFSFFTELKDRSGERDKEVRKRLLSELGSLGIVSALLASLSFGGLIAGLVPSSLAFATGWGAANYSPDVDYRTLTVEERFTINMLAAFLLELVAIGSCTIIFFGVCLTASSLVSMIDARHGYLGYVYNFLIVAYVFCLLALVVLMGVTMHASTYEKRAQASQVARTRWASDSKNPSARPSPRSRATSPNPARAAAM
eukprot:gnl/Hemi2/20571_TR6826_c0_g1_i1.p1 gnl/Hemi2/20571_TR6826_c0_g1~~gnl/Hemi2/20571_TR6826_c0_g1_i1.p1  ORF type:complete len:292 (-),score=80.77 gnl/Hemi2/20571_TR6826_c0_g1_i1:149-934(-)